MRFRTSRREKKFNVFEHHP
jgi:hypothetical protein